MRALISLSSILLSFATFTQAIPIEMEATAPSLNSAIIQAGKREVVVAYYDNVKRGPEAEASRHAAWVASAKVEDEPATGEEKRTYFKHEGSTTSSQYGDGGKDSD
ncbi:hypothetical protein P7C71_g6374, partial [Lecanoromycetidae sp. Uapishka_2]